MSSTISVTPNQMQTRTSNIKKKGSKVQYVSKSNGNKADTFSKKRKSKNNNDGKIIATIVASISILGVVAIALKNKKFSRVENPFEIKFEENFVAKEYQNFISRRKIKNLYVKENVFITDDAEIENVFSSNKKNIDVASNAKVGKIVSDSNVSVFDVSTVNEIVASDVRSFRNADIGKIVSSSEVSVNGNSTVKEIEAQKVFSRENAKIGKLKTKDALIMGNSSVDEIVASGRVSISQSSLDEKNDIVRIKSVHANELVASDNVIIDDVFVEKDGYIFDNAKIGNLYSKCDLSISDDSIVDAIVVDSDKTQTVFIRDKAKVGSIKFKNSPGYVKFYNFKGEKPKIENCIKSEQEKKPHLNYEASIPYEVKSALKLLGLENLPTLSDVKRKRLEFAKKYHPDRNVKTPELKNEYEEKLKDINAAIDVIEGYVKKTDNESFNL